MYNHECEEEEEEEEKEEEKEDDDDDQPGIEEELFLNLNLDHIVLSIFKYLDISSRHNFLEAMVCRPPFYYYYYLRCLPRKLVCKGNYFYVGSMKVPYFPHNINCTCETCQVYEALDFNMRDLTTCMCDYCTYGDRNFIHTYQYIG